MSNQLITIEALSHLFIELSPLEQEEVLHFAEFLLKKRTEKESSMHPDLRKELLFRKNEGLMEIDSAIEVDVMREKWESKLGVSL